MPKPETKLPPYFFPLTVDGSKIWCNLALAERIAEVGPPNGKVPDAYTIYYPDGREIEVENLTDIEALAEILGVKPPSGAR